MTHLLFFYREIRRLENLTDFDRVTGFGRATLRPFHDFFFLRRLHHPVTAEHFLRFDVGSVGHGRFALAKRDAGAGGLRVKSVQRGIISIMNFMVILLGNNCCATPLVVWRSPISTTLENHS